MPKVKSKKESESLSENNRDPVEGFKKHSTQQTRKMSKKDIVNMFESEMDKDRPKSVEQVLVKQMPFVQ